MNNDLEQFSEERLKELASTPEKYDHRYTCNMLNGDESRSLARIALAAKQAKPVACMYRDNLHSDARFSLTSQIGNWSSEEISEYEITEIPLYTTPQPDHTEQGKAVANEFLPENLDRALTIMGVALPESKEEFNFQAGRWMQRLINRVIRYEGEIQSQESHTEQDGWIKCSERMPTKMQCVSITDGYLVGVWRYRGWWPDFDGNGCASTSDPLILIKNITHWMPLPAAPKPESEL